MTTRQIEDCFDQERIAENYSKLRGFIYDPYLLSVEELKKLQNPTPGQIIRLKSMKHTHFLNYGEKDDLRNPSA